MFLANSLYLWAGLLLTVPIILHFLKHKPGTPKLFPSLFFLEKYIAKSSRRNKIRKWLLLTLRLLFLTALIGIFAWPYIGNSKMRTQSATIILVDNSMSSNSHGAKDFIAKSVAKEIAYADAENPVMLGIVTDQIIWSSDFFTDPAILKAFYEQNKKGVNKSSFRDIFASADIRLKRRQATDKKIVLISDRQYLPWSEVDFSKPLAATNNIKLLTPAFDAENTGNISINHAEIKELSLPGLDKLTLSAVIANYSNLPLKTVAEARIDQEPTSQLFEIVLKPNEVKTFAFALDITPRTNDVPLSGNIKLNLAEDNNIDQITEDNIRYFAFNPTELPTVFKQSDYAVEDEIFLRSALTDPGNKSGASTLKYLSGPSGKLSLEKVDQLPELYIVQTPPNDIEETVNQIKAVLDRRGNAVIVYHDSSGMRDLMSRLGFETVRRSVKGTFRLEMINFDHPIFFPYRNLKISNWFEILFFDIPQIKLPPGGQIVASFTGGIPAIIDLRSRNGHVYLIASSLKREKTNWPTFSTFLPFWRELARISAQNVRTKFSFETSSGMLESENKYLPMNIPGNYPIKAENDKSTLFYSINHPALESNLQFDCGELPIKKLEATTTLKDIEIEQNNQKNSFERPNDEIIKYLIIIAILLLIAESLLARRTAI